MFLAAVLLSCTVPKVSHPSKGKRNKGLFWLVHFAKQMCSCHKTDEIGSSSGWKCTGLLTFLPIGQSYSFLLTVSKQALHLFLDKVEHLHCLSGDCRIFPCHPLLKLLLQQTIRFCKLRFSSFRFH